jgi:hypothetical protein
VDGGGGGGDDETVQLADALALPAEFETVTRNVCVPTPSAEYDAGEAQAVAAALSREQVVLDTVPPVDHPNEAEVDVVELGGPLVSITVGAVGGGGVVDETVQVAVALALPAEFETLTRNVCVATASAEYDFGEAQAVAAAPSSEQVVLDTVPPVDHPNEAEVDVVELGGPLVSITVGAVGPPPPPESSNVPNSCDQ